MMGEFIILYCMLIENYTTIELCLFYLLTKFKGKFK